MKANDDQPFGPDIEDLDLPEDVAEQIEDVIADLDRAEGTRTLD